MLKKLILRNYQSPGDILMLTAAVRDLHRTHPGRFLTDVRSSCAALWENNPHLTPLRENDRAVRTINCEYPLIHRSNSGAMHFIWGFIEHLNEQLGTRIRLSVFRGDVHLGRKEKAGPSLLAQKVGTDLPYWIIVAGGKYDYTIKWWHFRRFQQVVDHFAGRILFVQVGERGHYHPPLSGVVSLVGQTNLRELIQLVHHADGVLCPVTMLMHLAAAVEAPPGRPANRPCVVVAGGREPPHWEAYPHHQFIHTVGMLPCCSEGGCWRARIAPLGYGDDKDRPEQVCRDRVDGLPRCMAMITPQDVIGRVEWYLASGSAPALTRRQARLAQAHTVLSLRQKLLPSTRAAV